MKRRMSFFCRVKGSCCRRNRLAFLFVLTTGISFLNKQYSVCRYFTFEIFHQL